MDVDTFPLTDALGLVVEHRLSEAVPYEIDTASAPPRNDSKFLGRKFLEA
jgi:hypothetical protein